MSNPYMVRFVSFDEQIAPFRTVYHSASYTNPVLYSNSFFLLPS